MSRKIPSPNAQRAVFRVPVVWLLGLVPLVFFVGVIIGSDGTIGQRALRLLAALGAPQYDAYKDMYAQGQTPGTVDYLLFFKDEQRSLSQAYFDTHPAVTITGDTVFDDAIVVALPRSSQSLVSELREQPFVWMLVRDRPFFFCH
ncbi:MAG: hypothetical protein ACI8PT_004630 [Gammaproteobacteria bacterium]|jgi:hypothetical protein